MQTIQTIAAFLEHLAPLRLAEDWDNVGLLLGAPGREVRRVMTCLTVTPESAAEAVAGSADLVVTHHPLPFRPVKRITTLSPVGRLLLQLAESKIGIYSAHTAFDSAAQGINQRLAEGLGLIDIVPLQPGDDGLGSGRLGLLREPLPLDALAARLKQFLKIQRLQRVGPSELEVRAVAFGCGAADELLDAAIQAGCQCMLLGEARFHTCLQAEEAGVGLLLPGHFASERFAMESLADMLANAFPDLKIWASQKERDPLQWV